MKKSNCAVYVCIALFIYVGCVSTQTQTRSDGVVIERNKQARPVWVDAPMSQLVESSKDAKLRYALLKQRDLPLAIKSTQSSAISSSYEPWRPIFDTQLKQLALFHQIRAKDDASRFDGLVEKAAHEVHAQSSQIEDIYYEKIRIDDPSMVPELKGVNEYFDVHVLIRIVPIENKRFLAIIKRVFGGAKSLETRKWAKELKIPIQSTNPTASGD